MSSWPTHKRPLEQALWEAVALVANQLGYSVEYQEFEVRCEQMGGCKPHPFSVDPFLAAQRGVSSEAMKTTLDTKGGASISTECPVAFKASEMLGDFLAEHPKLSLERDGREEIVDWHSIGGGQEIKFQQGDLPVLVNVKEWKSFLKGAQVYSDQQIVDMIAKMGRPDAPVKRAEAKFEMLKFVSVNKFDDCWRLAAKCNPETVGKRGRPLKKPPDKTTT